MSGARKAIFCAGTAWSRYISAKLQESALHARGDTRPALICFEKYVYTL